MAEEDATADVACALPSSAEGHPDCSFTLLSRIMQQGTRMSSYVLGVLT